MTKEELIQFENKIAKLFNDGHIPYLVHFSGGNESELIQIFSEVNQGDYIFSTHRSHYHYLLAGGDPNRLKDLIVNGKSMFVFDRKLNFYSSSIVCATPSIAAGVAWALKRKGSDKKVWCFVGDGAEDEGHLYEAVRYVDGHKLPCTFVIEDNNRSVVATKAQRWGNDNSFTWPDCVKYYSYVPTWPHGGAGGGMIDFKKSAVLETPPEKMSSQLVPIETDIRYKAAVDISMMKLSEKGAVFVGYNVLAGDAYGSLAKIPKENRLETPLAENLMAGLSIGMSLEGIKPVLFFERHDFIYNALDALVNQVDKLKTISNGEFNAPIIIKAVAGGIKPFYAGLTHTSNIAWWLRDAFHFPVFEPETAGEVLAAYEVAMDADYPVFISEKKVLY